MYKGSFPCIHMNYNNKKQKHQNQPKYLLLVLLIASRLQTYYASFQDN